MPRPRLQDNQWERIYAVLRMCPGIYVGQEPATRRFVEAVLWMALALARVAWLVILSVFAVDDIGGTEY